MFPRVTFLGATTKADSRGCEPVQRQASGSFRDSSRSRSRRDEGMVSQCLRKITELRRSSRLKLRNALASSDSNRQRLLIFRHTSPSLRLSMDCTSEQT